MIITDHQHGYEHGNNIRKKSDHNFGRRHHHQRHICVLQTVITSLAYTYVIIKFCFILAYTINLKSCCMG